MRPGYIRFHANRLGHSWEWRLDLDGKVYLRYASSLEELIERKKKFFARMEQKRRQGTLPTVGDFFEEWLRAQPFRPATTERYRAVYWIHLGRVFGSTGMETLTSADLYAFLRLKRRQMSRQEYQVLRSIVNSVVLRIEAWDQIPRPSEGEPAEGVPAEGSADFHRDPLRAGR
jgi:hypothetical protein